MLEYLSRINIYSLLLILGQNIKISLNTERSFIKYRAMSGTGTSVKFFSYTKNNHLSRKVKIEKEK